MASRLALMDGVSLLLQTNGTDHILLAADAATSDTTAKAVFCTPQHSLAQVATRIVRY